MIRKHLITLDKWLHKSGRKPLIIRGARQVGKSTLVHLFAKQTGHQLILVNLERYPELASVFEAKDPRRLLDVIETLPNMPAISENSILFLDEIQAVPSAIPMLRYLYEEMPQLPVISAGSLLEFTLADHTYSMPVGRVEFLHLEPMTFTEFLHAMQEPKLARLIEEYSFGQDGAKSIEAIVHKRVMDLVKEYYFVGGMPEAVKSYSTGRRLRDAGEVHASILEAYRDDFPKYIGSRDALRMRRVFQVAARTVGQKVKYNSISKDDTSATIKKDIELLSMARVLNKVVHSNCSVLPLQGDVLEKHYKLLFLDVGLMNAISGTSWDWLQHCSDDKLINEGVIAEQFIGQHLLESASSFNNRELNYWLREGRTGNAELDFVVAIGGEIVPVEVKAGASGSLRSLHQFMAEKNARIAVRFDANLPSLQTIQAKAIVGREEKLVEYQLISLPLYLVERLGGILDAVTNRGSVV